jgi:hypothetical protein
MYLFLIDDAQQRNCTRDGIQELIAIGGIIVLASVARDLDDAIARVCADFDFPQGEPFKWSPSTEYWMRDNLVEDRRTDFFRDVLRTAQRHGAKAQVAMVETGWGRAVAQAQTPTMDAMALALERLDNFLREERQCGLVIAAKPGGGPRDEDRLLAECLDMLNFGTDFVRLRQIATNVLTTPFKPSRLLQVADLIVSCSTALVAGNTPYSVPLMPDIKSMLRSNAQGCVGGVGMKLHPDARYVNLYHWLWGDTAYVRVGRPAAPLPWIGRPYANSADRYE